MKGFNKFKTRAILIVVFIAPVFFILFLRYCGENHYAIPVYYRHGANRNVSDCGFDTSQYRINTFPLVRPDGTVCDTSAIRGKFTVFSVRDTANARLNEQISFNLARTLGDLKKPQLVQAYIITDNIRPADNSPEDTVTNHFMQFVTGKKAGIFQFARCGLILPNDSIYNELVLADRQGRIRGYYNAARFNEYDRLQVELRILLKEMGNEE